jgi:hypothetical protein
MNGSQTDVNYLLSPVAIRERSLALFEHAINGKTHFKVNLDRLPEVSKYVLEVTKANYPDLNIPFHSRFGHFQAGGVDRLNILNEAIGNLNEVERARVKVELAVVSVLLDAGAGMDWKYADPMADGKIFSKSEGLAIASLDLFLKGAFHSEEKIGANAQGLQNFTRAKLEEGFQVSAANPLLGSEGRVSLINTLGKAFSGSRPGSLVDEWLIQAKLSSDGKTLKASKILDLILHRLGPIWPGRIVLNGVNLGDVWSHSLLGPKDRVASLVPFHKLSQWMSYSLIEPLTECGLQVINLDDLTGLPEYRNGGLLIDTGLIELRDPALANQEHTPDSELIIEWRALTVTLLDQIGNEVRRLLGKTTQELPLVKVLEGGTWHAGRRIAAKKRSDGGPPLKIKSDGTVF